MAAEQIAVNHNHGWSRPGPQTDVRQKPCLLFPTTQLNLALTKQTPASGRTCMTSEDTAEGTTPSDANTNQCTGNIKLLTKKSPPLLAPTPQHCLFTGPADWELTVSHSCSSGERRETPLPVLLPCPASQYPWVVSISFILYTSKGIISKPARKISAPNHS